MPLYVVRYKSPISSAQRDALAAAITKTHTTLFTTPSFFVSDQFEDISSTPYYVGGKAQSVNVIYAHDRAGASQPRSAYVQLCVKLRVAWEAVFPAGDAPLDLISVMDAIVAGDKKGFFLPEAGQDKEWMKENLDEFAKCAEDSDEKMKDLVGELRERGVLGDENEAARRTWEESGFGHTV